MADQISEGEYQEASGIVDEAGNPEAEPVAPLAKVEQKVQELAKATPGGVPTIAAERLGDVLPLSFYDGNSQYQITEQEAQVLEKYREAADEDIEIRPEGLIYIEHMFYRRALTEAFGTGGWALLPGSSVQIEPQKDGKRTCIFQRWVLRIHGHYFGEAIGSGSYFSDNKAQDKSDAAEAAASNALMRICAKSSLGIGTNPWNRRFQREWKRKHAIQVWAKEWNGPQKRWRRNDDDPLPNETGPVDTEKHLVGPVSGAKAELGGSGGSASGGGPDRKPSPAEHQAQKPDQRPSLAPPPKAAPPPPPPVPQGSGQIAPHAPATARSKAGDTRSKPGTTPSTPTQTDKVGEPEWRYLMALCRQKQLIRYNDETKADDASAAYAWLCEFLAVDPMEGTGKTVIERMRTLYMGQSLSMHREKIVPALKQLEVA